MTLCKIEELSVYHPPKVVNNEHVASKLNLENEFIKGATLERLFGIKERRYAEKDVQVSDLATKAALPIVEKVGRANIDFLIFASACQDLIEPATCNIIQEKLGLDCPCMDVKNACNSFLSGIQTATAFIQSGMYKNVLIVNGEKLSDSVNYNLEDMAHLKRSLAAFSLGDAGSAALITASDDDSGIHFQKFLTRGTHWEVCTIQGGGSMFPQDVTKNYFEGKTAELKDVLLTEAKTFTLDCIEKGGWKIEDIDHLVTHQVSLQSFEVICQSLDIPLSKNISVFEEYGNTAGSAIPLSLHKGMDEGLFKKGDKIVVLGLAAGISACVQLIVW